MRVYLVLAVALTLVAAVPLTAQDCGGDNPRRLLVTVAGHLTVTREGEVEFSPFPLTEYKTLIRVCDIKSMRDKGDGKTLLLLWSDPPASVERTVYQVLKEGLREICAALETCSDATKQGQQQ